MKQKNLNNLYHLLSSLPALFSLTLSQCHINILKIFKLQLFARAEYSVFHC